MKFMARACCMQADSSINPGACPLHASRASSGSSAWPPVTNCMRFYEWKSYFTRVCTPAIRWETFSHRTQKTHWSSCWYGQFLLLHHQDVFQLHVSFEESIKFSLQSQKNVCVHRCSSRRYDVLLVSHNHNLSIDITISWNSLVQAMTCIKKKVTPDILLQKAPEVLNEVDGAPIFSQEPKRFFPSFSKHGEKNHDSENCCCVQSLTLLVWHRAEIG